MGRETASVARGMAGSLQAGCQQSPWSSAEARRDTGDGMEGGTEGWERGEVKPLEGVRRAMALGWKAQGRKEGDKEGGSMGSTLLHARERRMKLEKDAIWTNRERQQAVESRLEASDYGDQQLQRQLCHVCSCASIPCTCMPFPCPTPRHTSTSAHQSTHPHRHAKAHIHIGMQHNAQWALHVGPVDERIRCAPLESPACKTPRDARPSPHSDLDAKRPLASSLGLLAASPPLPSPPLCSPPLPSLTLWRSEAHGEELLLQLSVSEVLRVPHPRLVAALVLLQGDGGGHWGGRGRRRRRGRRGTGRGAQTSGWER